MQQKKHMYENTFGFFVFRNLYICIEDGVQHSSWALHDEQMRQLLGLQVGAGGPFHPAEVQAVQGCPVLQQGVPGGALELLPQGPM